METRSLAHALARLLVLAVLAGVAALAPCGPAAADVSDAPLGITTPGPLRSLFLDLPLSDARGGGPVPSAEVRWFLANSWSTRTELFRGDQTVVVQQDVQADVLQLRVGLPWSLATRAPWAERVETLVEAQASELWGGWTDRPIEAWHALIGSWNFERQLHPRDAVNLTLAQKGGPTLIDLHGPRLALGDLALRTQVRLAAGAAAPGERPRWAVAARLDLKLPTGRLASGGGSGGVDAGLGLSATATPFTWFTVHALANVRAVSGLPHGFALQPRPLQAGLDLSLVVRLFRRVALVGETRLTTAPFETGWSIAPGVKEPEATASYSLFRPQQQLSGGLRVGEVTVWLSEDWTPGKRAATDPGPDWFYDTNAPDVVLGVSWRRGW